MIFFKKRAGLSPPARFRGVNDYDPNEPVITAAESNTKNAARSSARTVIKFLGTLSRSSSKKRTSGERRLTNRSEEHTSELQSRENIVCRRLLEKRKPN